jgi:aspartate aminotransferase-like enzyme
MPLPFYLDAARMGLMTPSTRLALQDFVRYVGENGCTLYFEKFLKDGCRALPLAEQDQYSGLRSWSGVRELRESLAKLVGTAANTPLLLAARTTKLVELAAKVLFRSCRRVLLTDLTWPSYRRIFQRYARRFGKEIVSVAIRSAILKRRAHADDISSWVANAFRSHRCDGMLLPDVSHDGIHLPWQFVAKRIKEQASSAMIVVDGGQALGQVPIDLTACPCDYYVAGCHKWMGTHLPLGIAVCPRPNTAPRFEQASCRLDDPLLRFLARMESKRINRFSETVNLACLFPSRAAINDLGPVDRSLAIRRQNAERIIASLDNSWEPLLPHSSMRAGTVLVRSTTFSVQEFNPDSLRRQFLLKGVSLTAYANGLLRLAMPACPWNSTEIAELATVFHEIEHAGRFVRTPSS